MFYVLSVVLLALAVFSELAMRSALTESDDPRSLIGIKTTQTLKSPTAWRAGHQRVLPLVRSGAVALTAHAVAVVGIGAGARRPALAENAAVVGVFVYVAYLLFLAVVANRAARQVSQNHD